MTKIPTAILSAQEFLEERQREALERDKSLSPLAMEFGDILASGLLVSLSEEQRAVIRDHQIAVGVLPSRQIEAYIERDPTGHAKIIGYSYGLMSFLIALNKILLSRVTLECPGLEPTIDLELAVRRTREVMAWFYRGAETFPRFTVDTTRTLMAATLAQTQAAFVIGHELGHQIARHSDAPPADDAEARAREYEADERGVEMVLSTFRRRVDLYSTNELNLAQAGIDILFTYLRFACDYMEVPRDLVDPTHPSPEERRQHFRKRYGGAIPDEAIDLAEQARGLFAWIGENVHFVESSAIESGPKPADAIPPGGPRGRPAPAVRKARPRAARTGTRKHSPSHDGRK